MMPVILKRCTFLLFLVVFYYGATAQYTVNGNALQQSCNEYRLTDALNTQSGSVWNNNKIDLSQPFDFKFDIFLGSKDADGADGIAFVLQPISTSVGSNGGGLGYEGISPALGVTIDTWQNTNNNDPSYDHVAIQLNGDLNHNGANNIAGPVQAAVSANIEDGNWHALRIVWAPAINTLTVSIDGIVRVSSVKNFVADVFGGNALVYWGFTGSTGGSNNLQKFKTALNPAFHFPVGQKRCVNEPIQFIDSTISFTNIVKFYWNFGDGSPIDSVNLNPVHTYTIGGNYTVTQRVIGADGCEALNTQTVRIGTIPYVTIQPNTNPVICADGVPFRATAWVDVGTVDSLGWNWDFDNGLTSNISNPTTTYSFAGIKTIKCTAKTLEGCISPVSQITLTIRSRAFADFTFDDTVCVGEPVQFISQTSSMGGDTVRYLLWDFDGGFNPLFNNIVNPVYTYSAPGIFKVTLLAVTNNSEPLYCPGIKSKTIVVKEKPQAIIGITSAPLCAAGVIHFTDSSTGGDTTAKAWSWRYNNIEWATTKNTSKTFLPGNQTVQLVATSLTGCKSDTAFKTFYVNPLPNVTINFKDACKFAPVNFTAVDNSGTVTQWKWDFGDGGIANTQNATHTYNANGTYKVKLYAITPNGCYADTLQKDITIYGTNASAGNDTIAAAGQPVVLHATGGLSYTWSPATLLNDASSATPTTILQGTQTFTLKAFTPEGCESYDDVTVKIYKGPDIYLPNAFTPNGDGLNDIFRGVPVGIQQFEYLKVFNRWGQLVFYTADYRNGWNGIWQSQQQPGGVYIVMAKGKDYKGNTIEKKASVMLIR